MKNYTITVNGSVYDVVVEEGATSGAPAAAAPAAPKAAPKAVWAAAYCIISTNWTSGRSCRL